MSHRPGSLCGNNDCPCAKPGVPCLGFEDYGSDDYDRRWCARCGWESEDHPTADDLRDTPAGRALMAEAWQEGAMAHASATSRMTPDVRRILNDLMAAANPYEETPDD